MIVFNDKIQIIYNYTKNPDDFPFCLLPPLTSSPNAKPFFPYKIRFSYKKATELFCLFLGGGICEGIDLSGDRFICKFNMIPKQKIFDF